MQSINAGDTLQIALNGPPATRNPSFWGSFTASVDQSVSAVTTILPTLLQGATPVSIMMTPPAGTLMSLLSFTMTNTDTAAVVAKILLNGVAGIVFTMQPGDVLQYGKNTDTWSVQTSAGGTKQALALGVSQVDGLQAALNAKADVPVTKSDVSLGNVDNTSDANKPVSTAQATAIGLKLDANKVGAASGAASLDTGGLHKASEYRLANTSAAGAISAAEHIKLATVPPGGWLDARSIDAINAAAPGVTMVVPIDIRNWTRGTYVANPSTVGAGEVGGGACFQADGAVVLTPDVIIPSIKTQSWAIRWRQRLAAPAAGKSLYVVVATDSILNSYGLFVSYSTSEIRGRQATNVMLQQFIYPTPGVQTCDSGVTGWVIDGLIHNCMLAVNVAKSNPDVTLYIDDVAIVSRLLSENHGPTGAGKIMVQCSSAYYNPITDMAYAV